MATAALLTLGACGGGGSPVPDQIRPGTLAMYYGEIEGTIPRTCTHTNAALVADWFPPEAIIVHMQQYKACGVRNLIVTVGNEIYTPDCKALARPASPRAHRAADDPCVTWSYRGQAASRLALRAFLQQMKDADVLDVVVGLYPMDEPSMHLHSEADVRAGVADSRAAAAEFGIAPGIWVIYNTGAGVIAPDAYDALSFDNYDQGERIFKKRDLFHDTEWSQLTDVVDCSRQRLFLTLGGSDPWDTPPDGAFRDALQRDGCILGMAFFTSFNYDAAHPGILDNSMAQRYYDVGRAIKCADGSCA